MRQRGQGGQSLSPKPPVGPPKPGFGAKIPTNPNWPKKDLGSVLTKDDYGPHFQRWPLVTPRGNQKLKSTLPLNSRGRFSHCSMHPILKDAGVVHIWYYIPLCTILAHQSIGDAFRTQLHDSKSRSQNPSPMTNEDSSAHQSGNPWWLSEDHFRTPTTCQNHMNPPSWNSIWHIHAIFNRSCLMALMVILSSGANLAPSP
ncbi:hypothetical protein O181_100560 [Austropuccinia psidii MF-1]|uniref:Uncharacterized protein n=1 Tax=Austropuccinia psidii MF-1 TaxID=1389203 RepID=A0A9Q3JFV7_9BASI|nr:hypothetical protein [Austropuccinia psidii MF-1]